MAVAEGLGNEAAAAKTEAHTATGLADCPWLVSRDVRGSSVLAGEAAIMGTHEKATDAAVSLAGLALIMHFKGKTTGVAAARSGGDDSMGPKLIEKYVMAMAEKYRDKVKGKLAVELLTFSRVTSVATVLTASGTADLDLRAMEAAASLAELKVKLGRK